MKQSRIVKWIVLLVVSLPVSSFSQLPQDVEKQFISVVPNIYVYGGLGWDIPLSQSMFSPVYYGSSAAGALGMEIADIARMGNMRVSLGGEMALHEFFNAMNRPLQGYLTGSILRMVTAQPQMLMEIRLGIGYGRFLNHIPALGQTKMYHGVFLPVEGALRINPHLKMSGQLRAYRVFSEVSGNGTQLYTTILFTLGYFMF